MSENTSDITAGHMIQGAGLSQVITTGHAAVIGSGSSIKQPTGESQSVQHFQVFYTVWMFSFMVWYVHTYVL